jgi:DNA polymerase-3 subunit beta
LELVLRAIPAKPSHDILNNVPLKVDAAAVQLTAFDLKSGIKTSFEATVYQSGSWTVPSIDLRDSVSQFPMLS